MKKLALFLILSLSMTSMIVAQKNTRPAKPAPKNAAPAAKPQPPSEPESEPEERLAVPQEGEATGAFVINGETIQLRYAYAKRKSFWDKKFGDARGIMLMLTDRFLAEDELEETFRVEYFSFGALRENDQKPRGIIFFINDKNELLKTQITEYEPTEKDPTARQQVAIEEKRRFKEFKLEGQRLTGKAEGFYTTRKGMKWSYTASFAAPLFDAEADAKPQPIAENANRVMGSVRYKDRMIQFTHVYAYTRKSYIPHWKQPNLILVFTDRAIADDEFDLDVEIPKLAAAGQIHAVEVEVSGSGREQAGRHQAENVHCEFYYEGAPSGAIRNQNLMERRGVEDPTQNERVLRYVDNGKVVEGIAYSRLLHGTGYRGRHIKWLYEAKFRAAIRNTEQAGKPLPAGGGLIGKAYLDFKKTEQGDPFETIRLGRPRIVRGFQNGNRATLTVHDESTVYTVRMILEGGKWKPAAEKLTDIIDR